MLSFNLLYITNNLNALTLYIKAVLYYTKMRCNFNVKSVGKINKRLLNGLNVINVQLTNFPFEGKLICEFKWCIIKIELFTVKICAVLHVTKIFLCKTIILTMYLLSRILKLKAEFQLLCHISVPN